jgi:hypothetical protein
MLTGTVDEQARNTPMPGQLLNLTLEMTSIELLAVLWDFDPVPLTASPC